MPAALEASTTQSIRIVRLSDLVDLMNPDPDPAKDLGPAKINSQLIEDVRGKLGGQKVSSVRVSLVEGLKKAKDLLEKAGGAADTAKVVHVVSDLRAIDWEVDGVGLTEAIRQMTEAGHQGPPDRRDDAVAADRQEQAARIQRQRRHRRVQAANARRGRG